MTRFYTLLLVLCASLQAMADGWPANYGGVMLQGFYWDSYSATKWTGLESQADELSRFFNLIWIPQSGYTGSSTSMGYDDMYWFTNYNSSFGTRDELKSMISTFSNKGLGTIADVVINHRKNVSTWFDFPAETYNGVTYQLQASDIVADDDGGATATEAAKSGVSLSTYKDTGDGWSGMRDLDHNSSNVQSNVKAYLHMLLDDLGYTGFRYDMVKGYSGKFIGIYNSDAKPTYSVGEYWDGYQSIENWMNTTKVNNEIQSAAFDFPMHDMVVNALNNGTYDFSSTILAKETAYNRYAVTFVENHDTELRADGSSNGALYKDTLAANAYMLSMPGTPCVFLKHWQDHKKDIKQMIDVRRLAGIHSQSGTIEWAKANGRYYALRTTGTKANLITVLGSGFNDPRNYTRVASGYHYNMYIENSAETAWADLPSGSYENSASVNLSAVSANSAAKVVYTLDGTTPTASSAVATTAISLPQGTTELKAALLIDGVVSGVISRSYTVTTFKGHTATVYLKDPNWSKVYFYAWDANGTINDSWPGKEITAKKEIDGATYYYRTFTINSSDYTFNIIFDQGSSNAQTVDIGPLNADTYFEISSTTNKFTVNNITSGITTGITHTAADDNTPNAVVDVYTIDGRLVRSKVKQAASTDGLEKGIYIVGGKKVMK